jgi:hypothetical protein
LKYIEPRLADMSKDRVGLEDIPFNNIKNNNGRSFLGTTPYGYDVLRPLTTWCISMGFKVDYRKKSGSLSVKTFNLMRQMLPIAVRPHNI